MVLCNLSPLGSTTTARSPPVTPTEASAAATSEDVLATSA